SKSTVATGNINPKEEVLIKPNISGIIDEVYVEAGDYIKSGDLLAKIRVVPNVSSLNSATNQIQTAKIDLENQKRIYDRQKSLFIKGWFLPKNLNPQQPLINKERQPYNATRQNAKLSRTETQKELPTFQQTL